MPPRFRAGDMVEVRAPDEIALTLDANGSLDQLPFMPEMLGLCGRRFRVLRRVVKSCSSGSRSSMRTFRTDDVVLLDGIRCSGMDHDGCQKACLIFWREAWLKPVSATDPPRTVSADAVDRLRQRLKTKTGPATYFCQASELLNATNAVSRWDRVRKCAVDIRAGNTGVFRMGQNIAIWIFWRARRALMGPYAAGSQKRTPAQTLGLRAGEPVDVRSIGDITATLDPQAHNRGLFFSPDMRLLCGKPARVERKLEKIIVDGSGQMRELHNTVYLEGSMCGCAYVAFGGCSRGEFAYWREIWLRRHDRIERGSESK